jgi:hypothetical protein
MQLHACVQRETKIEVKAAVLLHLNHLALPRKWSLDRDEWRESGGKVACGDAACGAGGLWGVLRHSLGCSQRETLLKESHAACDSVPWPDKRQ